MPNDAAGITDTIVVSLNGEPDPSRPYDPADYDQRDVVDDFKGPDPVQWDDHAARDEEPYADGDHSITRDDVEQDGTVTVVTGVKGPGAEWLPVEPAAERTLDQPTPTEAQDAPAVEG